MGSLNCFENWIFILIVLYNYSTFDIIIRKHSSSIVGKLHSNDCYYFKKVSFFIRVLKGSTEFSIGKRILSRDCRRETIPNGIDCDISNIY